MVQIVGGICMILFGAALVAIGLYLPMFGYAIVGGILVVAGVLLLVSFRRSRGKNIPPLR
jgi:membrane protein implicated in regulation of membrane protease activity